MALYGDNTLTIFEYEAFTPIGGTQFTKDKNIVFESLVIASKFKLAYVKTNVNIILIYDLSDLQMPKIKDKLTVPNQDKVTCIEYDEQNDILYAGNRCDIYYWTTGDK